MRSRTDCMILKVLRGNAEPRMAVVQSETGSFRIGRGSACDLSVQDSHVARLHLKLDMHEPDLGMQVLGINGVEVLDPEHQRIRIVPAPGEAPAVLLQPGAWILIGSAVIAVVAASEFVLRYHRRDGEAEDYPLPAEGITRVGKNPDNDIQITGSQFISGHHFDIERARYGGWILKDYSSDPIVPEDAQARGDLYRVRADTFSFSTSKESFEIVRLAPDDVIGEPVDGAAAEPEAGALETAGLSQGVLDFLKALENQPSFLRFCHHCGASVDLYPNPYAQAPLDPGRDSRPWPCDVCQDISIVDAASTHWIQKCGHCGNGGMHFCPACGIAVNRDEADPESRTVEFELPADSSRLQARISAATVILRSIDAQPNRRDRPLAGDLEGHFDFWFDGGAGYGGTGGGWRFEFPDGVRAHQPYSYEPGYPNISIRWPSGRWARLEFEDARERAGIEMPKRVTTVAGAVRVLERIDLEDGAWLSGSEGNVKSYRFDDNTEATVLFPEGSAAPEADCAVMIEWPDGGKACLRTGEESRRSPK